MDKYKKRRQKVDYPCRKYTYYHYMKQLTKSKKRYNMVGTVMYSKVLNDFNKEIRRKILEEAYEFIFPNKLGSLRIKKYKPLMIIDDNGKLNTDNLSVDWEKTNKLGKRVFHLNEHSDGYRYKFAYSNYRCLTPNKYFYKFVPCRAFKLSLAKIIKDENSNFDFYS